MSLVKTPVDLAEIRVGQVFTGQMTISGTTVTDISDRAHFTDADIGAPIWIIGASDPIDVSTTDNGMLRTVIVSVTSDDVCEVEDPATQTPDALSNCTVFRKRGSPQVNTFHINNSLTTHDTASFTFMDTLTPPLTLQPILGIVDGDKYFGGLIMRVKAIEVEGNEDYMKWQVDAVGWEVLAYGRTTGEPTDPDSPIANPVFGQFDNTLPSAIMKYLVVNALSSEGFDFVPEAEGVAIPSFKVSYAPCGNAFDNIITSATQGDPPQWMHWYISPDKKIVISDDTVGPAAPFDITDDADPEDYTVGTEIDEDGDTFVNRVIVREGNQASTPQAVPFTGDGSTKNWSLPSPAAGEPTITVDGDPKTVGVGGVNTGKDYYWNLNSTGISQDASGTAPILGAVIVITASMFEAGFATYYNEDAIDFASARQGGTGYHESVQQQDGPNSLVDGETYARAIGQQFGVIPKKLSIKTFKNGLRIGQNILVNKARWGVNSRFVIDSITVATDGAWVFWEVTALGSPLIDWDWRATLARLRPGDDTGGGGGGAPGPQAFWRVFDMHNLAEGTNKGPVLTVQETGPGLRILGVLRRTITEDLTVDVNVGGVLLETITIPEGTAIETEVSVSIKTKKLVKGQAITWDITNSDGQFDANGVATITVLWGIVNQVTVTGQWKGPWNGGSTYDLGDAVQHLGSSYISLQDDNTANEPLVEGTDFWDLIALKGDDGAGFPTGGTTGQVLTKLSDTDFDADWEDLPDLTPLTTVGDLVVYDGDVTRLPVGDDDDVLTADSGADAGVSWQPTKIEVQSDGISISTRHTLNFIGQGGMVITVIDDPDNNRVNIYIGSGSSGGGATGQGWNVINFGNIIGM